MEGATVLRGGVFGSSGVFGLNGVFQLSGWPKFFSSDHVIYWPMD